MENKISNPEQEKSVSALDRRKVMKTIVGGVATIAVYNLLPAKWGTPIIDSIILPAHAGTSGAATLTDPCSITDKGPVNPNTEIFNISGFVTPPVAGITINIKATADKSRITEYTTTTTNGSGNYSVDLDVTFNIPAGDTMVYFKTTAAGVSGAAHCSHLIAE